MNSMGFDIAVIITIITVFSFSFVFVCSPVLIKFLEFVMDLKNYLPCTDSKYDRTINCPACEGTGSVIKRYYGNELSLAVATSSDNSQQDNVFHHGNNIVGRYKACGFCDETGIAYAWYEKFRSDDIPCSTCSGTGQLVERRKVDIGLEKKIIVCGACQGTGVSSYTEKTIVHIKTLAGRAPDSIDLEENSINDYLNFYPPGSTPCRLKMEVSSEVKYLLKSQPRYTHTSDRIKSLVYQFGFVRSVWEATKTPE